MEFEVASFFPELWNEDQHEYIIRLEQYDIEILRCHIDPEFKRAPILRDRRNKKRGDRSGLARRIPLHTFAPCVGRLSMRNTYIESSRSVSDPD